MPCPLDGEQITSNEYKLKKAKRPQVSRQCKAKLLQYFCSSRSLVIHFLIGIF